jgi:hypothetical protein
MLKIPGTLFLSNPEEVIAEVIIETDVLKYVIDSDQDIRAEFSITDTLITSIIIYQGAKVIASNQVDDLDGSSRAFVSDKDLLVLDLSLEDGFYYAALGNMLPKSEPYIRGIKVSDLIGELDYEQVMDYINLIETNDPDASNLTETLISVSYNFEASFSYPNALTLYCLEEGVELAITTSQLNEAFALLYQLASVNKYTTVETQYLLDAEVKQLSDAVLLPKE